MSTKKDRERAEHERREHEGDQRERVRLDGTERRVHREIVLRWWEGSVPPTAQAYARALKQWRQLPGSIVTAPADLGTLPESPPADDSTQLPQNPGE